jgi:hypothetical protein
MTCGILFLDKCELIALTSRQSPWPAPFPARLNRRRLLTPALRAPRRPAPASSTDGARASTAGQRRADRIHDEKRARDPAVFVRRNVQMLQHRRRRDAQRTAREIVGDRAERQQPDHPAAQAFYLDRHVLPRVSSVRRASKRTVLRTNSSCGSLPAAYWFQPVQCSAAQSARLYAFCDTGYHKNSLENVILSR